MTGRCERLFRLSGGCGYFPTRLVTNPPKGGARGGLHAVAGACDRALCHGRTNRPARLTDRISDKLRANDQAVIPNMGFVMHFVGALLVQVGQ